MIKLEVGYNFIEQNSILNGKYEEFMQKMSIFQFFKLLKNEDLPEKLEIYGFDHFLYFINEQEENKLHQNVYQILSEKSNYLLKHKPIIKIVIKGRLMMNKSLLIYYRGKIISLTDIFGKNLIQKDLDWYHSNFNLS